MRTDRPVIGIVSDNAQTVWDFFRNKGFTNEGAAGVLGNLQHESLMKSVIYEFSKQKELGNISAEEYVKRVNSGKISKDKFISDGVGFGLAQWTYKTRKAALYEKCKGKIGDLSCQLKYLWTELSSSEYSSLIKYLKEKGHSVDSCTKKFMREFERPATEEYNSRLTYAKQFYKRFTGKSA